jgi:2-iminobutanoate/2-iminopropanoate deaminase
VVTLGTRTILEPKFFPRNLWFGIPGRDFQASDPAPLGRILLMSKEAISTSQAPAALGPYSQGIRLGNIVFTAGQGPIDPETQKVVAGGIVEQTTRVMENLKAILEAAGTSLEKAVKASVFLKDLNDFSAMNTIYARYMAPEGVAPPARTTVQAARLPGDILVEIDVIAEA